MPSGWGVNPPPLIAVRPLKPLFYVCLPLTNVNHLYRVRREEIAEGNAKALLEAEREGRNHRPGGINNHYKSTKKYKKINF